MAMNDNKLNLLNFRNCKRCGKPFSTTLHYTVCPHCIEVEQRRFERVRDYLYENPGSTEWEVAEYCDVTPEEITRWVREERLELAEESPILLPCEACRAPIRKGHFCPRCKAELHNRPVPSGTVTPPPSRSNHNSMHYFKT